MSQRGDAPGSQEDDWWRQLYDEDAARGTAPSTPSDAAPDVPGPDAGAGGGARNGPGAGPRSDPDPAAGAPPGASAGRSAGAPRGHRPEPGRGRDPLDAHFDSAVNAMSPPPAPREGTMRLRRPTPPPAPPSWPRPTRAVPPPPRRPDPWTPDPAANLPDAPELPPAVDVPDAPELPDMPGLGDAPSVPEAPGVPGPPDLSDIPKVPEGPSLDTPDVADAPDLPEPPDVPGIPDLPAYPRLPDTPSLETPSVPDAPDLPDFPHLPDAPRLGVPHLPDFPHLPAPPDLPAPPETGPPPAVGDLSEARAAAGPEAAAEAAPTARESADESANEPADTGGWDHWATPRPGSEAASPPAPEPRDRDSAAWDPWTAPPTFGRATPTPPPDPAPAGRPAEPEDARPSEPWSPSAPGRDPAASAPASYPAPAGRPAEPEDARPSEPWSPSAPDPESRHVTRSPAPETRQPWTVRRPHESAESGEPESERGTDRAEDAWRQGAPSRPERAREQEPAAERWPGVGQRPGPEGESGTQPRPGIGGAPVSERGPGVGQEPGAVGGPGAERRPGTERGSDVESGPGAGRSLGTDQGSGAEPTAEAEAEAEAGTWYATGAGHSGQDEADRGVSAVVDQAPAGASPPSRDREFASGTASTPSPEPAAESSGSAQPWDPWTAPPTFGRGAEEPDPRAEPVAGTPEAETPDEPQESADAARSAEEPWDPWTAAPTFGGAAREEPEDTPPPATPPPPRTWDSWVTPRAATPTAPAPAESWSSPTPVPAPAPAPTTPPEPEQAAQPPAVQPPAVRPAAEPPTADPPEPPADPRADDVPTGGDQAPPEPASGRPQPPFRDGALETAATEAEAETAPAPEPTPTAAKADAEQRPYPAQQFRTSAPQRHPASATPPAPVPQPATDDDRPLADDAADTTAAAASPADDTAARPAVAPDSEPAPREGNSAGETAFGVGEVRWAPELPPGWVPAQGARAEDVREPEVVGGGPPTYGAEPTAWPEARPDALDGLLADTVLDGASYGTWTLRTASIRGDSARYRGQPRRDALLTARFGDGDDALLLIAVASGARAADDAHRAAQDAVRWIAGAVGRSRARLADDLRAARRGSLKSGLHRLTDRCYGRLRARGEDLGLDEGTYTASLRCLLLPADPESRIRLFFGVGEGGLFRIRDGAWQDLDLAPDAASAPFRFRATVAQPGDALVMSSAGLAEPLRGEPELGAHLAERWGGGRVPGLAAYLADAQTRVKGYADDRTVVTVWDA